MKPVLKRVTVIFVLIAIAGLGFAGFTLLRNGGSGASVTFRTAPVKRGDLVASINATGTVEPEEVVDVGAQVAGRIVAFGKDKSGKIIDYGSVVEKGTVLAQIDDALYAATVAEAKAQLEQAKAGVQRAEADQEQLQAKLVQAERDWNRAKKLGPSDALARSDYDAALSAYDVAKANVAVGKAAIAQAKSTVAQSVASLSKAQQNLRYCTIVSPVEGIIIDRRVNIGQTVVSSLNAPSLFLIAKDLKQMQVWVSVNEADIGNIHPGQPVTFTVDTFPGEVFQGAVSKVRLNATMTQNVVTYTVEVSTDNSSGKLLPYLSANTRFAISDRRDVLLVPNVALRWTPLPDMVTPDSRAKAEKGEGHGGPPSSQDGTAPAAATEAAGRGVVWLLDGDYVRPVPVTVGVTDGITTEVQGEKLEENAQIVIGEKPAGSQSSSNPVSPFTPQFFKGGRGGGGR